jgi:hypothetical protein
MAVGNPFAKSQGFNFVSNNKYLQDDFTGSEPLDFSNVSSSGIMTQAPIIYPPINQGGDDRPVDPGPPDYGYTGPGSTGSTTGFNEYDIEEGTIDDEDIKNNQSKLSKMALIKAGLSTMFLGPFSGATSIYRSQKKAEQEARNKLDAEIAASDARYGISDARLTAGGASQETMDSYENSDGSYSGASTEDYGGGEKDGGFIDGSNRRPFNSGGRTGYFFGGRVNFKDGGLASIL